ncbi:MAG: hypothetical protein RML92_09455, partial [Bacteroidia bacterium]|nr:hypothetical protein [Bacteroidia bacterium]
MIALAQRTLILLSTGVTILGVYAQNVGIGTATPSERLHVNGNLRLDGAFMPGNNAGSVGAL